MSGYATNQDLTGILLTFDVESKRNETFRLYCHPVCFCSPLPSVRRGTEGEASCRQWSHRRGFFPTRDGRRVGERP